MPGMDVESRLRCWIEDAIASPDPEEDGSASFRLVAHAARAAIAAGHLDPARGVAVVADLFDALILRHRLPGHPGARPEWLWMSPFGGGGAPLVVPTTGRAWAPNLTIDLGSREVKLLHIVSWEGGMTMRSRSRTRWQVSGADGGGSDGVNAPLGRVVTDDRGRTYEARGARSSGAGEVTESVTDFATGLDQRAKALSFTIGGVSSSVAVPPPAPLKALEVRRRSPEEALESALLRELGALQPGHDPRDARRARAAAIVGLLADDDGQRWMHRFDEAVIHATADGPCADPWSAVARGYRRASDRRDPPRLVSGMAAGRVGGAVVVMGPLTMLGGRLSTTVWTDLVPTRWGYALGEEPFEPGVELGLGDGRLLVSGRTVLRHHQHRSAYDIQLTPAMELGAHALAGRLDVTIENEVGSIPIELPGLA
ncbi:MAG TPA: hypothetical protein VMY34_03695 [Acidimicrobiales bacterium]|nr:hypothetical protein [Acidimicrobiales bacterium]